MDARSVDKNKILKAFNKALQSHDNPIIRRLKGVTEAVNGANIPRDILCTILSELSQACPEFNANYYGGGPQRELNTIIRYLVRKILKEFTGGSNNSYKLGLHNFGKGEGEFIEAFRHLNRANILNPDNLLIVLEHQPFSYLAKAIITLDRGNDRSLTQESFMHLLAARGSCITVAAIFKAVYGLDPAYYSNVQHIIAQLEQPEGFLQAINDLKSSGLFRRSYVEALLDKQFLFQVNGTVIWNNIPSDLLTQDVLDEVFDLSKQPNPIDKINTFLEPYRLYAAARKTISSSEEKFNKIERSKWKVYGNLIGMPRYRFSEFLKEAFGWILGFEWVLHISNWLGLPRKKVTVPVLAFSSPESNDYMSRYMGDSYNPARAGHLVPGTKSYPISPLTFIFVPINYIMRTIGKLLAGLLLLPWTIPVTLVNRAVARIRVAANSAKIKKNIRMIAANGNQALLIRDWFAGKLRDTKYDKKASRFFRKHLLTHLDSDSIRVGIEEFNFASAFNPKPQNAQGSVDGRIANQVQTLRKVINKETKRITSVGIITTVLCAIFLTPLSLAVSIPLLVKRVRRNKSLLEGVQKGEENVKSIAESLKIIDSQGADKAFELGMKYLDEQNINDAYVFLSRVPKHDPNYLNAMNECGNILFVQGDHEAAGDFYEKAGNRGFAYISQRLGQGLDVSVDDAGIILHSKPSEDTPQPVPQPAQERSYSAGSPGLYTQPPSTGRSTGNTASATLRINNNNHE